MTIQRPLPDPQKVEQTNARLREVCQQFDALNELLDRAIVQVEADIRRHRRTTGRFERST
ncbi:MAG: hypothetical protein KME03_19070 [Aphanocapsa lilacina HA4352-LM1]|jgi:hypothetical protein|nr:hypothetical protein [Aphanocapsa lilacina HA4352-LM1]